MKFINIKTSYLIPFITRYCGINIRMPNLTIPIHSNIFNLYYLTQICYIHYSEKFALLSYHKKFWLCSDRIGTELPNAYLVTRVVKLYNMILRVYSKWSKSALKILYNKTLCVWLISMQRLLSWNAKSLHLGQNFSQCTSKFSQGI